MLIRPFFGNTQSLSSTAQAAVQPRNNNNRRQTQTLTSPARPNANNKGETQSLWPGLALVSAFHQAPTQDFSQNGQTANGHATVTTALAPSGNVLNVDAHPHQYIPLELVQRALGTDLFMPVDTNEVLGGKTDQTVLPFSASEASPAPVNGDAETMASSVGGEGPLTLSPDDEASPGRIGYEAETRDSTARSLQPPVATPSSENPANSYLVKLREQRKRAKEELQGYTGGITAATNSNQRAVATNNAPNLDLPPQVGMVAFPPEATEAIASLNRMIRENPRVLYRQQADKLIKIAQAALESHPDSTPDDWCFIPDHSNQNVFQTVLATLNLDAISWLLTHPVPAGHLKLVRNDVQSIYQYVKQQAEKIRALTQPILTAEPSPYSEQAQSLLTVLDDEDKASITPVHQALAKGHVSEAIALITAAKGSFGWDAPRRPIDLWLHLSHQGQNALTAAIKSQEPAAIRFVLRCKPGKAVLEEARQEVEKSQTLPKKLNTYLIWLDNAIQKATERAYKTLPKKEEMKNPFKSSVTPQVNVDYAATTPLPQVVPPPTQQLAPKTEALPNLPPEPSSSAAVPTPEAFVTRPLNATPTRPTTPPKVEVASTITNAEPQKWYQKGVIGSIGKKTGWW